MGIIVEDEVLRELRVAVREAIKNGKTLSELHSTLKTFNVDDQLIDTIFSNVEKELEEESSKEQSLENNSSLEEETSLSENNNFENSSEEQNTQEKEYNQNSNKEEKDTPPNEEEKENDQETEENNPEEQTNTKQESEEKKQENSPPNEETGNKDDKEEKKELDREEDKFSPEEFEALEKKEEGFFSKLFKKKKKETKEEEETKEEPITVLTPKQLSKELAKLQKGLEDENIATAKIGGKIDILNQKNEEASEHFQTINEKIGELRSTVLGRERMFNKLEDDFTTVKYVVNTFKPDHLDKRFDNLNNELVKISSFLEKLEMKTKLNEDKIIHFIELMKRIKSYENLLNELERMKKTESRMRQLKMDVEKAASKIEVITQNTTESISKINKADQRSESNEEAVKDITKSLGKIEARLEFLVKKEDFDFIKEEMKIIKKAIFEKNFKK